MRARESSPLLSADLTDERTRLSKTESRAQSGTASRVSAAANLRGATLSGPKSAFRLRMSLLPQPGRCSLSHWNW